MSDYDLDEIPEAKRYAPPQYRTPENQACIDMHRRLIYGPYQEREPLPAGSKMFPPPRQPPAINKVDEIAALFRSLTYIEMMELAAELWACRGDGIDEQGLPATLHRWSKTRGKEMTEEMA